MALPGMRGYGRDDNWQGGRNSAYGRLVRQIDIYICIYILYIRQTEIDRQIDRQVDKQIDRNRKIDRQINRQTDR